MDPKSLLNAILSDPDPNSDRVGLLENDLLAEYSRGYPLENLRPLLHSEDGRLIKVGLFIASELGAMATPLLRDVFPLLSHREKQVRFEVLNCLMSCAGPSNRLELASAVALLDDAQEAVRWKAMDLMWRVSREHLQSALSHLEVAEPRSRHVIGLQWLLGPGATSPEDVMTALKSPEFVTREYGMVAAARMSETDTRPLFLASTVEDPDIKRLADHCIGLYRMRLAQKAGRAERNQAAERQ